MPVIRHIVSRYRPGHPNLDFHRVHMLLLKSSQFLPNDYDTRSKLSIHEYLILTEFHNHWVKIVDFLIKEYVLWGAQVCRVKK